MNEIKSNNMKEKFIKLKTMVFNIAKENPWKGMLLGVAVGFALGAIIL